MSKRTGAAVAIIATAALFLSACSSGGGTPAQSAPQTPAPSAADTAARATGSATALAADGWATPQVLAVTPVAGSFHPVDPKFDALPGARAVYGTEDHAAGGQEAYQIEIPAAWNGEVVFFAHGFRGNAAELTVSAPPIREYLIANGYAWAATSYTENGYTPGTGARDTKDLRENFARLAGVAEPKRGYIYGQSMGGNVVTVSLALYPSLYDGAIAECGALTGQGIVDYFLSWGALAGYFSGTDITSASTDAGTFINTLRGKVVPALGSKPENLTQKGKAFESAVRYLTGGPRPYFREGFAANYLFNYLILANAVAVPGAANAVAQNADTLYGIDDGYGVTPEQLNRDVSRVRSNQAYLVEDPPGRLGPYAEFGAIDGRIERPLITLHGTGDLFVPITMEQQYRRAVDAAGSGDLLVQRAVRRAGHCMFSDQERQQAFTDLVAWVGQGRKPAGEDLLGDLSDAGRAFTQPMEADDPGGLAP